MVGHDGGVTSTQKPSLPALPTGWTLRPPGLDDLSALVALRAADKVPWTGSGQVDVDSIESEIAGPASWTRRQVVAVDPEGRPGGWAVLHDRTAGRTMVAVYIDRTLAQQHDLAEVLYAWAEQKACELMDFRQVELTQLEASPYADDLEQRSWLSRAGYDKHRTWLNMSRPVLPEETDSLAKPRPGVHVRRVASHANGLPVAEDLQLVHQMLEESFEDHFNSYRESFPEFVQRLREDPGHRWDHWWLAFVDIDGVALPAGAVVCAVQSAAEGSTEGSYVEYIGVHRRARGRGVAKSLLHTVIADAAERGRDRVGLEVDLESPTGANEIYSSMGWSTSYVTESWFKEVQAG